MISIPEPILAAIIREANDRFPCETGGVLLGRWAESDHAVATQMIGPGPLAKHGKATFEPDYDFQEAEIAKAYASACENLEYLGDWHSHPYGSFHPSETDVRVLRRIAGHSAARCQNPVMCILSGGPQWAASAWRLKNGRCIEIGVAPLPGQGGDTSARKPRRLRFIRNVWRAFW